MDLKYYIYYENGELNGGGCCIQLTEGVENIEVTEEVFNSYLEDKDRYVYSNGEIIENPNYEEDHKKTLRKELDQLTLTPADVERALYYSDLHMDFDDLKTFIHEKMPTLDIKGLAIEFRAKDFYRGAVDKDGNRIIDVVGALLGYTPEDMDYLFQNKELPSKN
jgi:hypothetical protein